MCLLTIMQNQFVNNHVIFFYSEKITRYATNADCNLADKGNLPANKGNIVVKCSENYPKTFRRLEV